MAKIVLDTVTGGYDLSVINNNFDKIEAELQNKVLYRNNPVGEANTLETDIDANGKRIYNLPEPLLDSEPARLQDLQNAVAGAAANLIIFTPYANLTSTNVQAAIQEEVDDLASIASGKGAALIGVQDSLGQFTANTVETVLRELGIRSAFIRPEEAPFNAVGDGITDDTTALASAVAASITTGKGLYLTGTYLVSGAIANFHTAHKFGPGSVKDGSGLFKAVPSAGDSITLFVAPSGSNSNIGVSAARPFQTVQAAVNAIPFNAIGSWTIDIAAGTYNELVSIRKLNHASLSITLIGKTVGEGGQTVILDGTGLGSSAIGIYMEHLAKVTVKDIAVNNFIANGVHFVSCDIGTATNVKVFNCGTAGAECFRASHGVVVATDCQIDGNNAATNGVVSYHSFLSFMSGTITKCSSAGALYAESAGGHFDNNTVSNSLIGLHALQGGFPTTTTTTFNTCTTGVLSDQGSYIVVASPTFVACTTNISQTINFGEGGKIRDDVNRTILFANNDSFDIITEGGEAFMLQVGSPGLTIPQGTWNGRHLILGSYHLWVDATGDLRIANGAPASDTAGVVVGTQT